MNIDNLHQKYSDCSGISTDTRTISKDNIFFALKGDNFDGNQFIDKAFKSGAKYVVFDDDTFIKDDDRRYIYVDNSLTTLQKLANYHRKKLQISILAITGSNGKTTTKELVNQVLSKKYNVIATKGNLNNHIGVPLTLLSMNESTEIGIVEMGTNHFGEIKTLCEIASPDFGYITNFGKAHLESFLNIDGVIKAKSEMYNYLHNHNKKVFVNGLDSKQIELTKHQNRTIIPPIELINSKDNYLSFKFNNKQIKTNLIGTYNKYNISAAITIGQFFRISDNAIIDAIASYRSKNNRSELIEKSNIKIILDAYNANPTSMLAALENFSSSNQKNKVVILGDMYELGEDTVNEHQNIVNFLKQQKFDQVYLIGKIFNKTTNKIFNHFTDFHDFENNFDNQKCLGKEILIKASRRMALERIVNLFDS